MGLSAKRTKTNNAYWECKCACGKTEPVLSQNLRRGLSTQCSSCRNEKNTRRFCEQGHDTEKCGRYKNGNCRECAILRKRPSTPRKELNKQNIKRLWEVFRLTPEDKEKILLFQRGVCAVSGKPMKYPNTDHDHSNGRIRGLLSMSINRGLAYFNDNPELLRKAADYLENPPAPRALGKETFGVVGVAKRKRKMIYGSADNKFFDKDGNQTDRKGKRK